MAVAELIVSRRALLAAACAPLLSRHPGLDPGSSSFLSETQSRWIPGQARNDEKWQKALARYRAAEAALAAAAHTEDEARYDRLGARHDSALKRLLRTPAPNLAGFAAKLDLAVDHQAWELTGGEACLAALLGDVRSLSASLP